MAEDNLEHPPRGYDTSDVAAQMGKPKRRRWKLVVAGLLLVPILLLVIYTVIALSFDYSTGVRAGYVQKFSHKGWLCKTWEGELAMVNLPGTVPEIFHFSVRDDSIAAVIDQNMGRRITLAYEQHKGVPSDCFGETEYYVTGVSKNE